MRECQKCANCMTITCPNTMKKCTSDEMISTHSVHHPQTLTVSLCLRSPLVVLLVHQTWFLQQVLLYICPENKQSRVRKSCCSSDNKSADIKWTIHGEEGWVACNYKDIKTTAEKRAQKQTRGNEGSYLIISVFNNLWNETPSQDSSHEEIK